MNSPGFASATRPCSDSPTKSASGFDFAPAIVSRFATAIVTRFATAIVTRFATGSGFDFVTAAGFAKTIRIAAAVASRSRRSGKRKQPVSICEF